MQKGLSENMEVGEQITVNVPQVGPRRSKKEIQCEIALTLPTLNSIITQVFNRHGLTMGHVLLVVGGPFTFP